MFFFYLYLFEVPNSIFVLGTSTCAFDIFFAMDIIGDQGFIEVEAG